MSSEVVQTCLSCAVLAGALVYLILRLQPVGQACAAACSRGRGTNLMPAQCSSAGCEGSYYSSMCCDEQISATELEFVDGCHFDHDGNGGFSLF